jgi:hypothetical protein
MHILRDRNTRLGQMKWDSGTIPTDQCCGSWRKIQNERIPTCNPPSNNALSLFQNHGHVILDQKLQWIINYLTISQSDHGT